jgi:hypothetical protein
MKTLFSITCAIFVGWTCQAIGATIPAGTLLTVRTVKAVASVDMAGTLVPAELEYPVAVSGKVVLPVGTYFSGKVITSRQLLRSPARLTVNLTAMRVGGRDIPITTTSPQLLSDALAERHSPGISRGYYTVAAGKRIQFQLARPVVI